MECIHYLIRIHISSGYLAIRPLRDNVPHSLIASGAFFLCANHAPFQTFYTLRYLLSLAYPLLLNFYTAAILRCFNIHFIATGCDINKCKLETHFCNIYNFRNNFFFFFFFFLIFKFYYKFEA